MTKDFKYYQVTATSMEVLKCWMKVPASVEYDEVWRKAKEIDGGNFVLDDQDWQFDDVVKLNLEIDKMPDEPIEYTEEEFEDV